MSAILAQVPTSLYMPVTAPNAGVATQRHNEPPAAAWTGYGNLKNLTATQSTHTLGQEAVEHYRWRGLLPMTVQPRPGWLLYAEDKWFAIQTATHSFLWTLELQRTTKPAGY